MWVKLLTRPNIAAFRFVGKVSCSQLHIMFEHSSTSLILPVYGQLHTTVEVWFPLTVKGTVHLLHLSSVLLLSRCTTGTHTLPIFPIFQRVTESPELLFVNLERIGASGRRWPALHNGPDPANLDWSMTWPYSSVPKHQHLVRRSWPSWFVPAPQSDSQSNKSENLFVMISRDCVDFITSPGRRVIMINMVVLLIITVRRDV